MVFCGKCGSPLGENPVNKFCAVCGTPITLSSAGGPPMSVSAVAAPDPVPAPEEMDPDMKDSAFDDLADNPFESEPQPPPIPPRASVSAPPAAPMPAPPPLQAPPLPARNPPPPAPVRQAPSPPPLGSPNNSAAPPPQSQYRERLIAFYQQYNPSKLRDPTFNVDAILASYRGREYQLFAELEKKYISTPPSAPPPSSAPPPYLSSADSSPRKQKYPESTPGGVPGGPAPAYQRQQSGMRPKGPASPTDFGGASEHPDHKNVTQIIDSLKVLYRNRIRPVEAQWKFYEFASPMLTDTDLEAKPMVLLLGQYSTGKTTFIKYLLEREFPGQRIGPEPTTDRFMAVMWGNDERIVPGNALAVEADKPFTALQKYGMAFLNKFEASLCPAPILETLTFVDTPGVLSGEKQRIGRSYDFPEVVEWFAERADRILLLFDAHKLDISDEFKSVIESLKGHDDKIRVVLNKADMITGQQLMRVYGALMWSLGKVFSTPEVLRVYIGSFWDQPLKNTESKALFEAESADLLADLRSLPRNSAVRKINELVKRARMAKVHAYIIAHLRNQFGWFGKEKTQQKLLGTLAEEFRKVQRIHNLPKGDFPNLRKFKEKLQDYEIHKFPKLDQQLIDAMDQVLSVDIPRLMKLLPGTNSHDADSFKHGSVLNPFDDQNAALRAAASMAWSIDAPLKQKYDNIFFNRLKLDENQKASGAVCRDFLQSTGLPVTALRAVWNLADIDRDGSLDSGEFAVAMYFVEALEKGTVQQLPPKLPHAMIPPNKRHLAQY